MNPHKFNVRRIAHVDSRLNDKLYECEKCFVQGWHTDALPNILKYKVFWTIDGNIIKITDGDKIEYLGCEFTDDEWDAKQIIE